MADFTIRKSHWLGHRFAVYDSGEKQLYTVKISGRRAMFSLPGDSVVIFEARPRSFLSLDIQLVEKAVDYVFASYKPSSTTKAADLFGASGEQVGMVVDARTWERFSAIDPAEREHTPLPTLHKLSRASLTWKELLASAKMRRVYYVIDPSAKLVATMEVNDKKDAISIELIDRSGRFVDNRQLLCLGLRYLALAATNK